MTSIDIGQKIRDPEKYVFQLCSLDLWPMTLAFKPVSEERYITDTHTDKTDVLLFTRVSTSGAEGKSIAEP